MCIIPPVFLLSLILEVFHKKCQTTNLPNLPLLSSLVRIVLHDMCNTTNQICVLLVLSLLIIVLHRMCDITNITMSSTFIITGAYSSSQYALYYKLNKNANCTVIATYSTSQNVWYYEHIHTFHFHCHRGWQYFTICVVLQT